MFPGVERHQETGCDEMKVDIYIRDGSLHQHALMYGWAKPEKGRVAVHPFSQGQCTKSTFWPPLHAWEALVLPGWSCRNPWLLWLKTPRAMGCGADVI